MNTVFSSKFVITIKTWSEEELKSFETWLKSPWCNSNKNLIQLLSKLKKYYPDFDDQRLSKEKLFRQVLPKGKFSTRRMNNLLSEAYLSAERFLIFQNLSQNHSLQKRLLTKELQSRHLEEWFFKSANKEIIRLEDKPVKDWEDHLALLQLNRRIYHHPNQHFRIQPGGLTIVKMGEQIDLLYLLEKAAVINEKISRNRVLKDENHEVTEELKKWQVASENIQHPSIEFYRKRFSYTNENMFEQYLELRDAFIKQFEALNEKEQKIHLLSLINDSSILIKAGQLNITEILPLYKLGLKTEILLHQGKLSYHTFITIVSASNTNGDFDYTNYFIDSYVEKINKQFQADALHWAKAHTAYRMEKLSECLDILLSYDFKISYFQHVTKILNTQVYFDLYLKDDSYQTYLLNYFDSFEKWLLREKLNAKTTKKSYLRFVQVCRSLAKSYSDADFRFEKVGSLLEKEKNIQAYNWLTQKRKEILDLKTKRSSNT